MVYGTEAAGGQVNTGGKISFYEEEAIPDEVAPIAPEESGSSSDQDTAGVKKPAGNLPSTGELIGNFGFIGIGLVLLFLLLIVLRRWTKEEK
ncbi:hypothetical protein C240_2047 [Enterococcus sp. 5H]|nr:hypothetical protein [Enterococcus sp. 5H]